MQIEPPPIAVSRPDTDGEPLDTETYLDWLRNQIAHLARRSTARRSARQGATSISGGANPHDHSPVVLLTGLARRPRPE